MKNASKIESLQETINMIEKELEKDISSLRQQYLFIRIAIIEAKIIKLQNGKS